MPPVKNYKCDKCGFSLPSGWGGFMYVTDPRGRKILCPHPGEAETVEMVLGPISLSDRAISERTGFNSNCICLNCLKQFDLDLGEDYWWFTAKAIARVRKDKRVCPKCKSQKVYSIREMIGKPCPKCKKGHIEEIFTGMIS